MMDNQPAYFMAFLSASSGTNFADYVKRYEAGEAVSKSGVRPFVEHPVELPDIAGSGQHEPPLANLNQNASHLDPQVKAYLEQSEPIARENFRARCPILPDERVVEDAVMALGSAWHGFDAGTLVYKRTTNLGTVLYGLPNMKIDLQTGKTSYLDPAPIPVAGPPRVTTRLAAVSSSDAASTVIDSALTIAQFAGFALGPEGLILSAGAAVLQMIFGKLFSNTYQQLTKQDVEDAVRSVAVELDLEDYHATFKEDYMWFMDRAKTWQDGMPPDSGQKCEDLRSTLKFKLEDNENGIVQKTLKLQEKDYRIPGISLFLLGASFILTLRKIQVIIESSEAKVVDTTSYTDLMSAVEDYISYSDNSDQSNPGVIQDMDGDIANRLKQVTGVHRNESCTPGVPDPTGGVIRSCYSEWDYEDGGTGTTYRFQDTEKSKGCKSQKVQHRDQAEASRSAYLAKLTSDLNNQYYHGDPGKAKDTVNQWKQMRDEFKKFSQ